MRIASAGQAGFAGIMIALGIQGLVKGDFTAVWQPVPNGAPAREVLIYLCALISLASGIGLFWRGTAAIAAHLLLASLVLWFLLWRVRALFLATLVDGTWSCGEAMAMIAGSWVLYAAFATGWERHGLGFATGERGATFIAASVAILAGVFARLAAALSALQMGLFGLLVWVPIIAAGPVSRFQQGEVATTLALTAAGWVVADSYRGMGWFGFAKR